MRECPITKLPVHNKCKVKTCPYHSKQDAKGCMHGQNIKVREWSYHKAMEISFTKTYLEEVDEKLKTWMALYQYANWCMDGKPTQEDTKSFARAKTREPLNTSLFGLIDLDRWAGMRDRVNLLKWQQKTSINIDLSKILEIQHG